ncbi:MAG: N-acetyl-gamma-glutamyl-phosphate reductase [Phycisphaera sp.]|nr:MAG: N-acetyl-gamma-glutamyl-phosphate reductase [Phycisphaera sp.]
MTLPIAIVGAGGYTGQELVELVLRHPSLHIEALFGSSDTAGKPFGSLVPRFHGCVNTMIRETSAQSIAATGVRHVFLATPHELSMTLAPKLVELGITVFDLSGAFRLSDLDLYPKYYNFAHANPDSVESALYTIPELCRESLPAAKLISLAGCYATSVILPMQPLVAAGLLDSSRPIVTDSVSGISGAGKKANAQTSFCEVSQSPYAVFTHRHEPEMIEHVGSDVIFTPHLAPYKRGILSTIHADLAPGVGRSQITDALETGFTDSPFVRLLPDGKWPSVGNVEHTNMIDIGFAVDDSRAHLILVSAIDNLLKGASGQAIQALNIHMDSEETLGFTAGSSA